MEASLFGDHAESVVWHHKSIVFISGIDVSNGDLIMNEVTTQRATAKRDTDTLLMVIIRLLKSMTT
jgi:hypothetical protein